MNFNNRLLKIKTIANLDFDIAKKNTHVLDKTAYWKLNAQIPFDNLFWLIEQAEKFERLAFDYDDLMFKINELKEEIGRVQAENRGLKYDNEILEKEVKRFEDMLKEISDFYSPED